MSDKLAFEYVMNLLSVEERQEIERKISADPELAGSVASWQQSLTNLDKTLVLQKPPARVWSNIQNELWPKPKKWSIYSSFMPYVTAFAGILLIALVSILILHNPYQVRFGDEWMLKADIDNGMLTIAAVEPAPMPVNMVCNLWIRDKDNKLMKVGVLPMHDAKTMDLKQTPKLYTMFKSKATLLISMDSLDNEVKVPTKTMYEVAWL